MKCTYKHCSNELTGAQEKFCSIRCRNNNNTQLARKRLKLKAVEYKGSKCSRCGYDKSMNALQFHHLDPAQKEFGIGGKGETRAWHKLKEELDKCVLLCANCHAEEHEKLDMQLS